MAMAFNDTNMIGSAAYPLEDRQSPVNRVVVKWIDAPSGFVEKALHVNDYEHQEQVRKINSVEVDGSAIDSYFQAWRIGQFVLAKHRDLGKFVEFRADIKASLLEVGDVIAVSAVECGLQSVPFRIIELGHEENDEVTIVAQLYSVSVYNDTAPRASIQVPALFGDITVGGGAPIVPNDVSDLVGSWSWAPEAADGSKDAILQVLYTAPGGAFLGVRAEWKVGSGDWFSGGDFDYNGIGQGAVRIPIAAPDPAQTVTVRLASRSAEYVKPFEAGTPSVAIANVGGSLAAENVASVTANAIYDTTKMGVPWGVQFTVTFGANRASIAEAQVTIIGPLTVAGADIAGVTRSQRWLTFRPPAAGNYTAQSDATWIRPGAEQWYRLSVQTVNARGDATDNPITSALFNVLPVNVSAQASSVSASTVDFGTLDGIGLFGFQVGYTPANDIDADHCRVYVEKSNGLGGWNARDLYTQTKEGGSDNGFAQLYAGSMIDAYPSPPVSYRVSFVTITRDGKERAGAPTVTVTPVAP
ncbi:MAG: phage tail protein, partial [Phycisphaerales bacterium]|nr:phage tail protein [Phycisphaerales bacterium]